MVSIRVAFLSGAGHEGISVHRISKSQSPKNKAGVQYKPLVCTVWVLRVTLVSPGHGRDLLKVQVPRPQSQASLVSTQWELGLFC